MKWKILIFRNVCITFDSSVNSTEKNQLIKIFCNKPFLHVYTNNQIFTLHFMYYSKVIFFYQGRDIFNYVLSSLKTCFFFISRYF